LNDLEDIDPELISSLKWMLNNDVTGLEHTFTYEINVLGINYTQLLGEDGTNTTLDELNKNSYIRKLCSTKCLKESEKQIQSFKQGFFEVLNEEAIKLFTPAELGTLISGKREIDFEDLKEHADYEGFTRTHQIVVWFWEIVKNWDQEMLANLLFFITGKFLRISLLRFI